MTIYSTTLISGTRGVKNGVKGCPKQHLLHRVCDVRVAVSLKRVAFSLSKAEMRQGRWK